MKTKQLRLMFMQDITPPNVVTLLLTDYEKGYNTGKYRFEKHLAKSAEGLNKHYRLIYQYNSTSKTSFDGNNLSEALGQANRFFSEIKQGQRTYR